MHRCLIVDDQEENLYLLEFVLEGAGYEVERAENGAEALEKARRRPPDVIISDILMPVMDGYALCREWKADEQLKHIPFIVYTATYTDPKDREFALGLGADRFVVKPQEPDVLIRLVREVLDESYSARQVAARPLGEEMEIFRQHNEILFRKLEKKMSDLEAVNHQLQILEEKYRLTFEHVTDVIITIDADLVISSISPCLERILGYKPEEFVGRPVIDMKTILTPDSFERVASDVEMILHGDTIEAASYRFIARDGCIKHGEVSGSPIRSSGRIVGMVSIARDVTERRKMEEKLQEAYAKRQELEFIINHSPAIACLWRAMPEWPVEYVSESIALWGYVPEDFTSGRIKYMSIIHQEDLPRVEMEVEQFTREGRPEYSQEYRILTRSGEIRWVDDRTWIRRGPDGSITHYQGIAIDITDRKRAEEALLRSENRFRQLFERMCSCAVIYEAVDDGQDFVIRDFNRAAERLEKIKKEEVSGRRVTEVFPGVRDFGLFAVFRRVWETGRPEDHDITFYQDHRIEGWRENHVFRLPSGEIVALYEDVTDRKQAEETLRESENRYRALFENSIDAVLLTVPDGRVLAANPEACRIFGRTEEEICSVGRAGLVDLTDPRLSKGLAEREHTGRVRGEVTFIRKDGTRFPGEVSSVIFKDRDGNAKTSMVIRDITERKHAEEALRESEAKYRNILEDMDDAYFELNLRGDLVFFNEALVGKTGYTREELMGMNYRKFISPETSKPVLDVFSEIYKTGQPVRLFDYEVIMRDGQVRNYESWAGLLSDEHGNPIGFRGMARDITTRKQAEKNLQETLENLRKALGTTIHVLVSAVETRDPYTAGHQVRVSELAANIAEEMGLSRDRIEGLRMAAVIHDIGKLYVPAEILSKPKRLREIEFALVREHAQKGYEILKDVESPWQLAETVYQHHERMDGSGYPRNLKGEEIILEARILAVSDVVESMASHRPYRPTLGIEAAVEEIERNRGILYDRDVVDACLRLIREKGYSVLQ